MSRRIKISENYYPDKSHRFFPSELNGKIDQESYHQFMERLYNNYVKLTRGREMMMIFFISLIILSFMGTGEGIGILIVLLIFVSFNDNTQSSYEIEMQNLNIECLKYGFEYQIVDGILYVKYGV